VFGRVTATAVTLALARGANEGPPEWLARARRLTQVNCFEEAEFLKKSFQNYFAVLFIAPSRVRRQTDESPNAGARGLETSGRREDFFHRQVVVARRLAASRKDDSGKKSRARAGVLLY
jgi:hypothetical protein